MCIIKKPLSSKFAFVAAIFVLFGLTTYADSLSRFLPEKYAFLQFNSYASQISNPPTTTWLNSISGDVFLGEFPLIISYEPLDRGITLFTALPRFIPLYLGAGRYTEIGYINMYDKIAFIHSLGLGVRLHIFPFSYLPYVFLSSKIYRFAIGGIIYSNGNFEFTTGLFLNGISVSIRVKSLKSIYSNISIKLRGEFALNLQTGTKNGRFSATLGIGLYHTDLSDNDYFLDPHKFKEGAHRGSIQKFPENSYLAFKYAMNKKTYSFIEFDVYKTLDNRYVIVHDPILLRYTGELKQITKLTLNELKKRNMSRISFRKHPTRILTLKEIAKELENSDKNLVIEIKQIGTSKKDIISFIKRVKKLFGKGKRKEIIFLSTSPQIVKLIKKNCKNRVAFLFPIFNLSNYSSTLLKRELEYYLKETGADMIFFYTSMLDKRELIEKLSRQMRFAYAYWNFHDIIYQRDPQYQTINTNLYPK